MCQSEFVAFYQSGRVHAECRIIDTWGALSPAHDRQVWQLFQQFDLYGFAIVVGRRQKYEFDMHLISSPPKIASYGAQSQTDDRASHATGSWPRPLQRTINQRFGRRLRDYRIRKPQVAVSEDRLPVSGTSQRKRSPSCSCASLRSL